MGVKKPITGILGKIRRAVPWLKPYHLVTMVILAILVAHGFMIYSYMNQTDRNEQLDSELAASKKDLVRKENSIRNDDLVVAFQEAGKQLANIRRLVPNYVDNTEFTAWLLGMAKESDVVISNLAHRSSSPQQVGEREYLIMGYNLNVDGTSSDLVAFVAALERTDRQLLVVSSTQYSSSDQGAKLSIELAVYTLPGTQQSGSLTTDSDGGSSSITIQVITEEEDGSGNLAFSSGLSSSMNAGEGAVAEQDFMFSPSYSRPFSVKRSDIAAPSQPLMPGIYTINYDVPRGWDMVESSCTDGSPAGAIFLAGGEEVTCTFKYARRGFIFVDVETSPRDPQEFQFGSDYGDDFTLTQVDAAFSSEPLVKGRYSLGHTVPTGWDLTGIDCDDGSPANGDKVQIDLEPGEVVTCTYRFDKQGHILVEIETLPADDSQEFILASSFDKGAFSLSHGGIRHESRSLVPGAYWVESQSDVAGWDLAAARCDDGSEVDAISLQPGEVINCTFTYAKRGYILAEVITNPKSDGQRFSIIPDYGEEFTLFHAGPRHESQPLKPGVYELGYAVPDNWELTRVTCDNGSLIEANSEEAEKIAISVEAGEIVYCTFRYSKGA